MANTNNSRIEKHLSKDIIEIYLESRSSQNDIYDDIKPKLKLNQKNKESDIDTIRSSIGKYLLDGQFPDVETIMEEAHIDGDQYYPEKYDVKAWQSGSGKWLKSLSATLKNKDYLLSSKELQSKLTDDLKQYSPKVKRSASKKDEDLIYMLGISDVHFGKISVNGETQKELEQRMLNCTKELLDEIADRNVSKIIFPLGNDLFNIDSGANTTTAGTPQTNSVLWYDLFQKCRDIIIECIEMCLEIAPVEIISVPGNHDHNSSTSLAFVIDAWFHNNENVSVDLDINDRKYYHWGTNLLGFTHGDQERTDSLPNLMATEVPKKWGETKYRMFFMGHLHKKAEKTYRSADECYGVRMRTLSSLSTTDDWHQKKGYVGNLKSAEGFLFSKKRGLITTHERNYF